MYPAFTQFETRRRRFEEELTLRRSPRRRPSRLPRWRRLVGGRTRTALSGGDPSGTCRDAPSARVRPYYVYDRLIYGD